VAVRRLRRCPYCLRYYDVRDEPADQRVPETSERNGHSGALSSPGASGSWVRPAGLTLAMLLGSAWVIAWHQDASALLAAAVFLLLAAHGWLSWSRRHRTPRGHSTPRA
jgi:hypothetical protein